MAIYTTLNAFDIVRMAEAYGRLENFGYDGWRAIAEYLENLSCDFGENIEIDIIAICCEYQKFDSVDDVINDYRLTDSMDFSYMDEEEKHEAVIEWLRENTSVVCEDIDCIIVQQF